MTAQTHDIERELRQACLSVDLTLTETQVQLLSKYVQQLCKWNRVHNLTAITKVGAIVREHLLDSLALLPHLGQAQRFIDVGSGGGLPGIPLAIMTPERHYTLLDAVGKKTAFLTHVTGVLGLSNVEVVHARVEDYKPAEPFDVVLSRAFTQLHKMIALTKYLLNESGFYLALKGAMSAEELAALPDQVEITQYAPYNPSLSSERMIVLIRDKH